MAASIEIELSTYLKESAEEVVHSTHASPDRIFFLRTSQLPFCGLRRFLFHAKNGIQSENHMDPFGYYNVEVGITAHRVIQDVLARGGRIIGDWKCITCHHETFFSRQGACPRCGSRMQYEELDIAWRTWRGHTDGLYVAKTKDKWVIDYKTTGLEKIRSTRIQPVLAYKEQQERYVVFLEQEHDIEIEGWALIYIARDNPFKDHQIVPVPMSAKRKATILNQAILESKLNRSLWKIKDVKGATPLIEHKLCSSQEDHDKKFPWQKCENCRECFDPKKLKEHVAKIVGESSNLPLTRLMPRHIYFQLYESDLLKR